MLLNDGSNTKAHETPAFIKEAPSSAIMDLLWVILTTFLFFFISAQYQISEKIQLLTSPWERFQVDELPVTLLFFSLALTWYAWRRARQATKELQQRQRLEVRLAQTLKENQRLSLSHVSVQEAERKALARELHDELGQQLNAIHIDAVYIRNRATSESVEVLQATQSILQLIQQIQSTLREMLRRLRPVGLDELGLSAAVEHLIEQWQHRHPHTRVHLDFGTPPTPFSEMQNMTCYRMIQETLNNVSRHTRASNVWIQFEVSGQHLAAPRVRLTVRDDGESISATQSEKGLGLIGLRERVEALGGEVMIRTSYQGGFWVQAQFPLQCPEYWH